jgi:hypothetical protein
MYIWIQKKFAPENSQDERFFLERLDFLVKGSFGGRYAHSLGSQRNVATSSGVNCTQSGFISKRRSNILQRRDSRSRYLQASSV